MGLQHPEEADVDAARCRGYILGLYAARCAAEVGLWPDGTEMAATGSQPGKEVMNMNTPHNCVPGSKGNCAICGAHMPGGR